MENMLLKVKCGKCGNINGLNVPKSFFGKKVTRKCQHCPSMFSIEIPVPEKNTQLSLAIETEESDLTTYQKFILNDDYQTIGRLSNSEIVPDIAIKTIDKTMSRIHAVIRKVNNKFTISVKPDTTNQTHRNSKLIIKGEDEVYLMNGDVIQLGQTILKVTIINSENTNVL